jgi:hypothetical protein
MYFVTVGEFNFSYLVLIGFMLVPSERKAQVGKAKVDFTIICFLLSLGGGRHEGGGGGSPGWKVGRTALMEEDPWTYLRSVIQDGEVPPRELDVPHYRGPEPCAMSQHRHKSESWGGRRELTRSELVGWAEALRPVWPWWLQQL